MKLKLKLASMFLCIFIAVSKYAYADVTIFQNGASLFSMGLADGDKVVLPPQYWIEEDEYSFYFSSGIEGLYGFYDKASGCLHPVEYDFIGDDCFTEPDAPVLVGKDGYYGYVYRDKCEIVIPMIYQSYGEYSQFQNGYAIIGKEPFTLAGGNGFVL